MKTVTVQIGNSDDKLTQKQWFEFCKSVEYGIDDYAFNVHFRGYSSPMAWWQNAAYVFDINDIQIDRLKTYLSTCASEFNQDSIAWLEGNTIFVN